MPPVSKALSPRVISGVWAIYALATTGSYIGARVDALETVTSIVPRLSVAGMWAIVTVLLAAGTVIPPVGRWAAVGRVTRTTGMSLLTMLLVAWAVTYTIVSIEDLSRMYVSAKNYLFLALFAVASAYYTGRDYITRE